MDKKYFLQIEIRYSIPEDENLPEDVYQETDFSKYIHSDLFDTVEDCIKCGDKLIQENHWVEQFPGYIGLKNGAEIFIQVEELLIHNFTEMNTELHKFNIDKIYGKI